MEGGEGEGERRKEREAERYLGSEGRGGRWIVGKREGERERGGSQCTKGRDRQRKGGGKKRGQAEGQRHRQRICSPG